MCAKFDFHHIWAHFEIVHLWNIRFYCMSRPNLLYVLQPELILSTNHNLIVTWEHPILPVLSSKFLFPTDVHALYLYVYCTFVYLWILLMDMGTTFEHLNLLIWLTNCWINKHLANGDASFMWKLVIKLQHHLMTASFQN